MESTKAGIFIIYQGNILVTYKNDNSYVY